MNDTGTLIWTEVFGCGRIAAPVLLSFVAHHEHTIVVFGTPEDFAVLPHHPRIRPVLATRTEYGSDWEAIDARYRAGHLGTAHLWAGLIRSGRFSNLVHVDADQVFLGNAVDDVLEGLSKGAMACGPRREQGGNQNGRDDVRHRLDTLATFCFGFKTRAVPRWPHWYLVRAIQGRRVSWARPLDFFDPLVTAFHRRGHRVDYLDSPMSGPRGSVDLDSSFLRKILSMPSAAASGCAIETRGQTPMSGYQRYAVGNWAFFATHLLEMSVDYPMPSYPEVERLLARLDRRDWTLRST